jgi:plasmid stability protein
MGHMTVRNIPDDQFTELKRVAARNNRSAEAEVRQATMRHIRAETGTGFGTELHRAHDGVIPDDFRFERDRTPPAPMTFE